jgi:hypothetical protein
VLDNTERSVDEEQRADHRRLDMGAERELNGDRGFEQPRNRPPELLEQRRERRSGLLGDGVGATSSEPPSRLIARQPGRDRSRGDRRAIQHDARGVGAAAPVRRLSRHQ